MLNNRPASPIIRKPGPSPAAKPVVPDESIIPSAIGKIQAVLDYIGHRTYLLPPDNENRVEQLFVSLETENDLDQELEDIEHEDAEIVTAEEEEATEEDVPLVHIVYLNDLARENEPEKIADDTFTLQFFVTLPVEIKAEHKSGLLELLAALNRFLAIGHFGWSGQEGVYYRYCLMSRQKEIDSVLLVEIMQMIGFIVNKFSPEISKMAQGIKTQGKIRLID
jgi:hypothetical protein